MADAKVTALVANTTVEPTDILYLVDNPLGTPASQKATVAAVRAGANPMTAAGDLIIGGTSGSESRLERGTAYQVVKAGSATGTVEWMTGGRTLISSQTPTGASIVSWASIPATFSNLSLEYVARSGSVADYTTLSLFLNSDLAASNYRDTMILGYGTTTAAATGADVAIVGYIPGTTACANSCGAGKVTIPQYAGTTFKKQAIYQYSMRVDASVTGEFIGSGGLEWENTGAINRIDITTSGSFVAGTTFRLYGET
jgi:hypothetical protein